MKKVVLITGSSTGIGQETAYAFAKAGYAVVVTHYNQKKEGEATARKCIELGAPSALLVPLDITNDKSIKSVISAVKRKYGHIDVLVNDAGVLVVKPFAKQKVKEIKFQVRTNLEGTMKFTLAALPLIRKAIITVASHLGSIPYENCAVYCATKWGLRGFVKTLALEQKKLKVIAVNPSTTATRMTGFKGIHPANVADLILGAATGKHKVESGGDVDVWKIYNQVLP